MTTIDQTPFAQLEAQERLLNPVLKQATHKPGRFGFRGTLALKLAPVLAGEKRPPDLAVDQVIAVANAGEKTIPFFAAYLLSFEYLSTLAEVLDGLVDANGKYFLFVENVSKKSVINYEGVTYYILPIDEATVYNELLELFYLEKNDLKKLDTAGKVDAIADAAPKFTGKYETITYEQGLSVMGPVRNRNENRPV